MELLLDSQIRTWVFLPIVIVTFLVGIVRHYIALFLQEPKKVELVQIQVGFGFRVFKPFPSSRF